MARIRVGVVIDRGTESQRSHCLLKRATDSRGMQMATVDAIPIRKLAHRVVLRKAIC
jgi:hypothetical protein